MWKSMTYVKPYLKSFMTEFMPDNNLIRIRDCATACHHSVFPYSPENENIKSSVWQQITNLNW